MEFMYRVSMTARNGKKYCSSFVGEFKQALAFMEEVLERSRRNEICGCETEKDVVKCDLYVQEILPFEFVESRCLHE